MGLNCDRDRPSLSSCRLFPLKVSEHRKKCSTMGEVRALVSDHTLESLLPRRDAENLSTSWSYPETVK
jgi:hypothetical protein